MKAMIFAAGLGTRLKPLTDRIPKALVEINGIPLLEIVINRLISFGFNEIIVNVHHFSWQVKDFLRKKNNFNIRIEISDESDLLLDTGGGLKKAAGFFNDNQPFLVHNVDIISEIDLTDFYEAHLHSRAMATLAVKNRRSSRCFLFDDDNTLCGWKNDKTGEQKITRFTGTELQPMAFSGIHMISPKIFEYIKSEGAFSIVNTYLQLSVDHKICAYTHDDTFWMDLGKPEAIKKAEERLR